MKKYLFLLFFASVLQAHSETKIILRQTAAEINQNLDLVKLNNAAWSATVAYTSRVASLEQAVVYRTDLDGGWYYPDWFNWSFSQTADGIPDSTTVVTNQDVILDRAIYSATGGSWDIYFSEQRSADFATPVVTSANPSVATTTVEKVWYISEGTATVSATAGNFTRSTDLVMALVDAITNDTVTGSAAGSAANAFAGGIDTRLTDGSDAAVYSTQDHNTPSYVRNTASWVADVDLTCVSPWNSTGGRLHAGTLIGSDCIIFADHYPIADGATVRFVTAANAVIERTLAATFASPQGDFRVGKLSAAISTNDCRAALLMPPDQNSYMPYSGYYWTARPAFWINQYENAFVWDLISPDIIKPSPVAVRVPYGADVVNGDSGSPVMLITTTSLPVFCGTLSSALGALGSTVYHNAAIRAAAATLGCDTATIIDADFAALGFTNFSPAPPPGE